MVKDHSDSEKGVEFTCIISVLTNSKLTERDIEIATCCIGNKVM